MAQARGIHVPPGTCSSYPKILTMWLYPWVLSPKDADAMADSRRVYTFCLSLSVRKFRISMVQKEVQTIPKVLHYLVFLAGQDQCVCFERNAGGYEVWCNLSFVYMSGVLTKEKNVSKLTMFLQAFKFFSVPFSCSVYLKYPQNLDTPKIAVVVLKFE